jgi:hypothetical protein
MTMGNHYETMAARETGVERYNPTQQLGGSDDFVPSGQYAIGLDLSDGGAFYVGTVLELQNLVGAINMRLEQIVATDAKPLTLDDFEWDGEDHTFTCPRCDAFFEPDTDLMALVHEIQNHIKQQHPTTDLSVE